MFLKQQPVREGNACQGYQQLAKASYLLFRPSGLAGKHLGMNAHTRTGPVSPLQPDHELQTGMMPQRDEAQPFVQLHHPSSWPGSKLDIHTLHVQVHCPKVQRQRYWTCA